MSSRTERKRKEREQRKQERREKRKNSVKKRVEEFKLNRQGKTNRKRSDVMSKHRKTSKRLTLLISIVVLLLVIVWIYILFI
jgi:Flp pilus assembly protein TadB